jgi:hypothetical protein
VPLALKPDVLGFLAGSLGQGLLELYPGTHRGGYLLHRSKSDGERREAGDGGADVSPVPLHKASMAVCGASMPTCALSSVLTSRGTRFSVVPKEMKRRKVIQALKQQRCTPEGGTKHEKWACPCGKHHAIIPRHGDISPGVIGNTIKGMECLPEGWLQ